jgi:hypothetical protein
MAWIKEELEGIKEQDKTLIDIFKKVQGDVKELNVFVTNNRSSSSLQGTPSSAPPPPSQPQQTPSVQKDASLELDFDALDDEDDELSESGEHKTSSLSGGSPSPPLPSSSSRGLTDSGTSYLNLDTQLNFAGGRDNLSARPTNQSGGEVGRKSGVTGVSGSKDSAPMSPTGGISLSLGSLDLDFDFPSSFGLGTISEGRSLMNIPTTISDTSHYEGSSSAATSSGQTSSQKAGTGGLQRSVSQQPLQAPSVSEKGQNNTYQPQKKPPPQTAPKPRRGASVNQGPPPTMFNSLQRNGQLPPLSRPMAQPAISKIGQQSSESSSVRLSPQQARKEMMKSTPALFPSPPRSRRNTDSLPRPSNSQVMTPLLPFHAQQELREAAHRAKQESSSGKKSSNGVIPHMTPGSPILIRKGGSSKQSSPPLSAYRSTTGGGNSKHSPIHGQRNSPTSSRLYPAHLSPGGMKGSSSMTRLAPSSSYSSSTSRGTQDETSSTMSRNSSMDSGIQYISEGETGGGATTGERASNTSTTTTDSIATTTSLTSAGSGVKEPVGRNEDTATTKKEEKKVVETGGLGDFSDVLSVLSNW